MTQRRKVRSRTAVLRKRSCAALVPLLLSLSACSSTDLPGDPVTSAGGAGAGGSPSSVPAAGSPASGGSAEIAGAAGNATVPTAGAAAGGAGGTANAAGSAGVLSAAGQGGGAVSSGGQGGSVATDPGTDGDGDVDVGPSYTKQSDLTSKGAPVGKSFTFTMSSSDSQIYTGLDRTLNTPSAFTRRIDVYVPAKYEDGAAAPFLIINDGPGALGNVKLALDNLTPATDPKHRLPTFIAIAVANGGGDSLGSERGLEYDTMSDRFARFVDTEVLPAVLADPKIKAAYPHFALTKDPEGRGALGCSSGAAAALTMGWFSPDSFRKLVTYSGTFVNQQDTDAPEKAMYPLGAWGYHSEQSLIANSPVKPLRIVLNANENDNGATAPASGYHNWVIANQRTAAALKAKGYHYRYIFGKGAGHCEGKVQDATLADSLIWVWRGYP
ncbi:MAG: alpha/beta hydrolase-fold protein [Polyangiaceae bacterium]